MSRGVEISSGSKVLYPKPKITKADVVGYLESVADRMLPHIARRPLTMQRFPRGVAGPGFMEKDTAGKYPEWIPRVSIDKKDGTTTYLICSDLDTLRYVANLNTLVFHVPQSPADSFPDPDQLVIDLDPSSPDAAPLTAAAGWARDALAAAGLTPYVKTSGSKGYHVMAPIERGAKVESVYRFMDGLAKELAAQHPDVLTTEFSKADREGRIYVDIDRNAPAQTVVAPYSPRATSGATVSTPLTWEELEEGVAPGAFGITDMPERLKSPCPWADFRHNASKFDPKGT